MCVCIFLKSILLTEINIALSIRRRALDLLYGMCDVTNAKDIVEELLQVHQCWMWTIYFILF
jgi:hypothetical protein